MRVNISLLAATLLYLLGGAAPARGAEYYLPPAGAVVSKPAKPPQPLAQADKLLTPSIAVGEEYTDNVFVTSDNRAADFITRVLPGIAIKYGAPFWDWDIGYNLDYRYYARNSRNEDYTHRLAAKGALRLIENFLYLDVSDTYRRVSLDVNRDVTTDSLFVNQSDQNILAVSPYVMFSPRPNLTVKSGYQFTKATYTGSAAVDMEEHRGFLLTTHELTPRSTVATNFIFAHHVTSQDVSYNRFTPSLGLRFEYADKSFISLEGGYSWFAYGGGNSFNSPYWNAGLTHTFDFMTASVNAGVAYNTDPVRSSTEERKVVARLDKALHRGAVGLSMSYTDVMNNETDALLSRKYGIGGSGKYELAEKVVTNLDLVAERIRQYDSAGLTASTGYPYRFLIGAGVSYAMANDLSAALNYNRTTYRFSAGSAAGSTDVNRVIVEVRKVF